MFNLQVYNSPTLYWVIAIQTILKIFTPLLLRSLLYFESQSSASGPSACGTTVLLVIIVVFRIFHLQNHTIFPGINVWIVRGIALVRFWTIWRHFAPEKNRKLERKPTRRSHSLRCWERADVLGPASLGHEDRTLMFDRPKQSLRRVGYTSFSVLSFIELYKVWNGMTKV